MLIICVHSEQVPGTSDDSGRALSEEEDRMGGSALAEVIESVTPHWAPSVSNSREQREEDEGTLAVNVNDC